VHAAPIPDFIGIGWLLALTVAVIARGLSHLAR
jgi:hypothetical protein